MRPEGREPLADREGDGDHTAAGSTRRHWEWGLAWGAAVGTGEVWMGFWRQEMAFRMGGEFGGWALRWMRVIEEGQGQRSTDQVVE